MRVKFAFREAVQRQDITTLKMLMCNCIGATQVRRVIAKELFDGFTPLQRACLERNSEMASLFIEYGVDIEKQGKYGWTALHAACFACRPGQSSSTITLLLNSCANVVAKDDHGCLAVDLAENKEVRKLLLAKMVEKGHSELAEMYRKLDRIKNSSRNNILVAWLEDRERKLCNKEYENRTEEKQVEREKTKNDLLNREIFARSIFCTSCEQREQLLSDRPILRRERGLGMRRTASLNVKCRRDSGISVDSSDSVTYI